MLYKPAGIPSARLKSVELSLDELEAMRLVDAEMMDQATAAEQLNVSRATVGRILSSGREKVANALSHGMAIVIGAGDASLEFYNGCPWCSRNSRCERTIEETDKNDWSEDESSD
jgi:predicted DNA-binding protein (UPF0251 family)